MTTHVEVGLCRTCVNAQIVTTARQSTFYLCRLSSTDPRFPKYPALPVRQCGGYIHEDDSADQRVPVD